MSERRRLVVHGRVQGVGYRFACAEAARALGVDGYVRNLPAGGVEVVGAGAPAALAALEAWCRGGPAGARVEALEITEAPEEELAEGFTVRA